jgi:hypothetical protein
MPTKISSPTKLESKSATKISESNASKRFPNNGHVCMNAAESKALQELLHNEKARSEFFKLNMHSMTRSRNPLLGEPTPREGKELLLHSTFHNNYFTIAVISVHR